MKICYICKVEKELTEFSKDKNNKDGFTYDCKKCRKVKYKAWYDANPEKVRNIIERDKPYRKTYYSENKERYKLKYIERNYSISSEDYLEIKEKQGNKCAICGLDERTVRNKELAVDHCHTSNKVRGLLCSQCNRALGLFQDSTEILEKALNYLKNNNNVSKPDFIDGLL